MKKVYGQEVLAATQSAKGNKKNFGHSNRYNKNNSNGNEIKPNYVQFVRRQREDIAPKSMQ